MSKAKSEVKSVENGLAECGTVEGTTGGTVAPPVTSPAEQVRNAVKKSGMRKSPCRADLRKLAVVFPDVSFPDPKKKSALDALIATYLDSCRPRANLPPKLAVGTYPNLAGFFRFYGLGLSALDALRDGDRATYDYFLAVFEDASLSQSVLLSPTVVSVYLKHRLGYGEKSSSDGDVKVIFDHGLSEDDE